ncbi:helix-turn-helix transcriptional regulator [Micromonospora sp. AMSO31t]|uniref:ArsR/SmtB family transcription factor n=1 Tax=Micromonospora sp. AMSO31t TaxID=2650566 RepID=UPI00124B5BD7|nr:metalloregulator ArsR/SmtB family transcription factor [Micromonospora sp. AMSO31t]KAB1915630.1 winged helix-turn-helix transcriptional regulator [Micromonospora sp. AMSO31t]
MNTDVDPTDSGPHIDSAVDTLRLIAHPLRIRILLHLRKADACVTDLSAALRIPPPHVSHQLRHLRHAHLVRRYRDGSRMNYALAGDLAASLVDDVLRYCRHHFDRTPRPAADPDEASGSMPTALTSDGPASATRRCEAH